MLGTTVLFIVFITYLYIGSDQNSRIIILRSIAAVLLISEVIKLIVMKFTGVPVLENLPLEVCSFAGYSIIIDSIFPGETIMTELLFMPAAVMALIFPTTSILPVFNFYTIQQFLYHALIIAYVIARYAAGEFSFSYSGLWRSILIIFILMLIIYAIDTRFKVNFFFLKDTYGNPMLELIWRYGKGGIGYVAGLVCFSITMLHVFFLIFMIA